MIVAVQGPVPVIDPIVPVVLTVALGTLPNSIFLSSIDSVLEFIVVDVPVIVKLPEMLTSPLTSSNAVGDVVPIPTLPLVVIRIFSLLFVLHLCDNPSCITSIYEVYASFAAVHWNEDPLNVPKRLISVPVRTWNLPIGLVVPTPTLP